MPTDALERFLAKLLRLSEQSSPFRRWTTGSGTGSSYRHHDHRTMYNKQMSEGASPVGATGGGGATSVARWSLGLEQLLADPAGAAAFAHFLAKEFAAENIRFWWSCEQYSALTDGAERALLANKIWQRHLAEGAMEPVNVDAAARRAAALLLYHDPPPPDLFQQAQKQIFNVMKFDSYPRFLRSAVHAECARADLRGLPPPYPPHHPPHHPPHAHHAELTTPPRSPNKLKKSASNASERRRSGGAFWWSCEQYSALTDGAERALLANKIWQRHLAEGAMEPVNVDAAARRAAALLLYHDPPPPDLFQQAQKQIFNVMKFDSYPRFLRSAVHAECARADLRGLPPPYPPHHPPHHPPHAHHAELTTPPRSPNKNGNAPCDMRVNSNGCATGAASVSGAGAGAGARVRAALRAGAPLHHHPPDFLENLRETQRQRLQDKPEVPGAAPPPPAAPATPSQRTPPPLPPKPSQRTAPTVV
ncbi:hypothetical protein O3G_MSEX014650 [Manduca sexta]|uniref:RGS domain-containing protein n=1 Tax=Manduca sexta TaxID=7130 RepID=A0A921ZW02_MANSE|nr:hypothetical protein O3G_MSEX014650 [Manduca sexta]